MRLRRYGEIGGAQIGEIDVFERGFHIRRGIAICIDFEYFMD